MTAPAADLDNLGNDMPEAGHEGDAMPNPDPGSSAAGESGAEPGDGHEVLCLRGGGGESSEEEEGSVSDGERDAASARSSRPSSNRGR